MTWPTAALGDVATIDRRGVDPRSLPGDTLYVGLEHIERGGRIVGRQTVEEAQLASAKFAFDDSHVLFGKLRPNLGKVARPTFGGVCSTDILPIRPGGRLDRGFLHHFLKQPSMVDFAASRTTGANLPRLSPATLASFEIPLPSLEEQRRIAAILDTVDALHAMRAQADAHFDDLTQSIFSSMFDGESFPETPLGEIVDPSDRINYGVVQPGDHVEDGVPLIRVSDLRGGHVDRSNLKRISREIETKYSRSRIRGNEVLISCVGSIGVVAIATSDDIGANVARAVTRVPISDDSLRLYVAAVLSSARVQRYFRNELRTVSQPTLNGKQIAETAIPVPPAAMIKQFALRLESIQPLRWSIDKSSHGLDELRESLTAKAFGGQL